MAATPRSRPASPRDAGAGQLTTTAVNVASGRAARSRAADGPDALAARADDTIAELAGAEPAGAPAALGPYSMLLDDAFGSGGLFQTCFAVGLGGPPSLLVDCGATSMTALRQQRIYPNEIDTVLLSHLPFLGLDGQFRRRTADLTVVGPPGTSAHGDGGAVPGAPAP